MAVSAHNCYLTNFVVVEFENTGWSGDMAADIAVMADMVVMAAHDCVIAT